MSLQFSCKVNNRALALALAAAVAACEPLAPPGDDRDPTELGPPPITGHPALSAPCEGAAAAAPRYLAVTTTDFSTGAVSVVDLNDGVIHRDVALGSTDAKPFAHDGLLYLLHRYMIDSLDVIDPGDGWRTVAQRAIEVDDASSANPQSIAFAPDGLAYITLFASAAVQVYDLSDPRAPRLTGALDLRGLSDPDGSPEAGLAIVCGDALFIALQRLDSRDGYRPRYDHDVVVALDRASGRPYDRDPGAPGIQPIELQGRFARQWRLDPEDPEGHTLIVLSEGLERLDLRAGHSAWILSPEELAPLGITSYLQPQAFALDLRGSAYLAAYTADFTQVELLRVELTGGPPKRLLGGLQTTEQALEIIDQTLWIGDRSLGHAGMRAFDLRHDPPTPLDQAPLATGLAPYAVVALPWP
jgi:hypothetical protein